MRSITMAALCAAVLIWANAASATEAGDWIVRAGVSYIVPKGTNATFPIEDEIIAKLDVDDAAMLTFDGTYMITDSFGVELLAALPFKHDVYVKAAGEKDKAATVKHLPPTLSAVYKFNPAGQFQPYIGAGVNWTIFFDEKAKGLLSEADADLKLDNSVGLAAVAGIDIALTETMFLNGNIRYMDIDTDVKVDIPGEERTTIKTKVDPWIYAINIGWRF